MASGLFLVGIGLIDVSRRPRLPPTLPRSATMPVSGRLPSTYREKTCFDRLCLWRQATPCGGYNRPAFCAAFSISVYTL